MRASDDEEIRSDAFFPDREQFGEETFRLTAERYATMTPLYPEDSRRKSSSLTRPISLKSQFSESRDGLGRSYSEDYHRPKSPFEGVQAIIPVAVLHMGQAMKHGYDNCAPGASCVPTLASLDSSPCPARQSDPCAPRPPCYPSTCFHSDSHTVTSTWTEWSPCSRSCGPGTRTRQCSGVGCVGPTVEPCVIAAVCHEWSPWSAWSVCSASCGEGERKRTRECIGGRDCPGVSMTVETCTAAACPVWSDWGPWEGCSLTCGQGQERRSRKCQSSVFCPGPANESRMCNLGECPQWTAWTSWSTCTKSCDTGETVRTRECERGKSCEGASEERLLCNQHDCPSWGEWTAWTVCANKCDEDSYRIRNRVCMYRGMAHAGCEGSAQDQSTCPTRACPTWSDWEDWSECSATCGQGNQSRMRTCENGSGCPGSNREIRFCQLTSCPYWDEWMGWSGCSVTCGIGVCERRRRCVTDDLVNLPNLEELDEALFEMESGPADRAKSMLIARSRSEVQSSAYRNHSAEDAARRAPARATIEGGGTCIGSDNERKPCDAGPCCSWDSWSEWSPCTGCGPQAISRRSRVCKMVESSAVFTSSSSQLDYGHIDVIGAHRLTDSYIRGPLAVGIVQSMTPIVPVNHRRRRQAIYSQRGVNCCEGSAFETRQCNTVCDTPRSCEWTEWSDWCGCTRCRVGKEIRRRFCDRLDSKDGSSDLSCHCSGRDTEERDCIVEKICDAMHLSGRGPSTVGGGHPVDEHGYYEPINARQEDAELHKQDDEYKISMLSRKDSTLSTTTFAYTICRWSKWSEWSQCNDNKKRNRNRFCIGSDTLVSDCECAGFSTEEDNCDSTGTTLRVVNEVDFSISKGRSDPDINSDDEKKLEESIQSALKVDESTQNKNEVSLTTSVIKAEKCEWTRWSQWSACTVSCGTGDRLRKRRCSCGDLRCGNGLDQEASKCSEWKCDKKMHPVFKID
ncbi:hypothetical protein RB195_021106 [Necator americanus]|uniref:Thrombospondin type 1 domain protein n=1 Tax=Necator americanus TaxID=51031 RepID=A0ABR1E9Q4_NECAM